MINPSINSNSLQQIMRHWRIIFLVWIIITALTSGFGLSSIVISPLHPIYFVLVAIFPSTLLLIISLITSHSIFSQIFLGLKNLIFKHNDYVNFQTQLPVRYIVQLISNTTWLTILTSSIVVLFFKFTFQHFDFYLGNTFTESKEITIQVIRFLNFFPEKLGLITFDYQLIDATFIKNGLDDIGRSLWAKWTIIMILFHGLLPRVIVFTYYLIRARFYTLTTSSQITASNIIITDAAKEKPLVIRAPKEKVRGQGHYKIALDIADQIRLTADVKKLNDMDSFQQFESTYKKSPAELIEIFVDGNLMPDRGLLRRLIRLLNLTETATIYVLTHDHYQAAIWQQHLSSILVEGETAHYETT